MVLNVCGLWVLHINKAISGRLLGKTLFMVFQKHFVLFTGLTSAPVVPRHWWVRGRLLGTKWDGSTKCILHPTHPQFKGKSHFIYYSWRSSKMMTLKKSWPLSTQFNILCDSIDGRHKVLAHIEDQWFIEKNFHVIVWVVSWGNHF